MGARTGDEGEFQEEEEDNDEQVDFESRVSLNISTQENEAYTDRGTGHHGPTWCSEENKQNHKHIRPVRRLCENDKFGNAN